MVLAMKLLIKLAMHGWLKIFLVNRENFKVLVYWYYFGSNVDKEKLLSVWCENKNVVCVIYTECVEVLYFCSGMING